MTESQRRYFHRRFLERKAQGVCTMCGQREAKAGSVHCEKCLEYFRIKGMERYHRLIAEHRCVCCGEPLSDFEKRQKCFACRIRQAQGGKKHD